MKLISSKWLTATITQSYKQEIYGFDNLTLCFTIDSGEFSWRNVLKNIPLNKKSLENLQKDLLLGGFFCILDQQSELFYSQFIGQRFKIQVDRMVDGAVVRNVIIDYDVAETSAEFNVLKEKEDSHFFEKTQGRDLPI